MAFNFADIVPSPSGSPADGGVRSARAASSPNSSAGRKSFSNVLQGIREDAKKGGARETDDVRSPYKSARESRSKDTQSQNPSSPQTERAGASPSRAQAQEGNKSGDDKKNAEEAKNEQESTSQLSRASADAQGQVTAPLLASVSPQILTQANDQTIGQTEGEQLDSEGDHVTEEEVESDGNSPHASSMAPTGANCLATACGSAEDHSLPDNERSAQRDVPVHEPDTQVSRPRNDAGVELVVKPSSPMVAPDSDSEIAPRAEPRPVPLESPVNSALSQPETMVHRVVHTPLGTGLLNSKPEIPKTDSGLRNDVPLDRSAPIQMNRPAHTSVDNQDTGVKTGWVFPQGQHANVAEFKQLSELWSDVNNPAHDQSEITLPQGAVADRQVSTGQPTESIIAGAHGRAIATPPPTSQASSFLSQMPPSVPVHDTGGPSVHMMARAVVVDVAQPDLGHVNIRMAMTNDLVHTYLSVDRPEVGQFLLNGQDRLQTAFQTNGLDMGQFRVDIDRQNGGRSFQQGSSQEQGQSGNQGSQNMPWGKSADRQDESRTSLHGLLNVVA